jgi:hypothetical protein
MGRESPILYDQRSLNHHDRLIGARYDLVCLVISMQAVIENNKDTIFYVTIFTNG